MSVSSSQTKRSKTGWKETARTERTSRNGSVTFTPEATFETGSFTVTVMKPFGAGDAFIGGLIAALLRGKSVETAVTRGTAAAAYVVSRRGCGSAMPTATEIEMLISRRPVPTGGKDAYSAP